MITTLRPQLSSPQLRNISRTGNRIFLSQTALVVWLAFDILLLCMLDPWLLQAWLWTTHSWTKPFGIRNPLSYHIKHKRHIKVWQVVPCPRIKARSACWLALSAGGLALAGSFSLMKPSLHGESGKNYFQSTRLDLPYLQLRQSTHQPRKGSI